MVIALARSCDRVADSGTTSRALHRWVWFLFALAGLLLTACGGGALQADSSDIEPVASRQGVTPFIHFVDLRGKSVSQLTAVVFRVEPKAGTQSTAVLVRYAKEALERKHYASHDGDTMTVPLFGLYAGHLNRITLLLVFKDASTQTLSLDIPTAAYADPSQIYDRPTILKKRTAGSELGFSFFAMKSALGTPVVVDTDGEIRWVAAGVANGRSAVFHRNAFVIGDQTSTAFYQLELDGSLSERRLMGAGYTKFHHNIDPGKQGLLAEMDAEFNGVANLETIVAEFDDAGTVLREWNFESLLAAYMRSQNDDPAKFVRPGTDWLHINAATYDARDNSLIVSSRENFVFKVDYDSGALMWILGDPTKYWYSFPSLRAKALTLEGGGLYPIGQHATSITSDGLLMVFNDGGPSFNQPVGAPAGESRSWSAVSAYAIDPVARTAREAWRFDHNQSIRSDICSSAYEAHGGSLLVAYSVASSRTRARLVGLDPARNVVFDFEYRTFSCNTSWNAVPVPFDGMQFN